jgi:hypothetical protein
MENLLQTNRLAIEINDWNSKEESLKKLFRSSPSIENSILKEKLKWYESVLVRYSKANTLDESLILQIVKKEHNNLVEKIYKNKFKQFVYKNMFSKMALNLKSNINRRSEMKYNKLLHDKVERAGFKQVLKNVDKCIIVGQKEFSIPLSYYQNEKERLDHSLNFKKDESGQYDFVGFKMSIYDHSKAEDIKEHFFVADQVNAKQAYELLSGRAVLTDNTWKQFDLNDKDVDRNYRVKEFPQEYGFDLKNAVEELPLINIDRLQISDLLSSLSNGRREMIALSINDEVRKFYIEANPHIRGLSIYNESSKKVHLAVVLGQNKKSAYKQKSVVQLASSQKQVRAISKSL